MDRARRRRPGSVDVFRHHLDLQDALALSLLVAVQEAIDVAFHIVEVLLEKNEATRRARRTRRKLAKSA